MKTCALCSQKVSQTVPLSYEMKDVQICGNCRSILNMIRQADTISEENQSKSLSYMEEYWGNITDKKVREYVDNVAKPFIEKNRQINAARDEQQKREELKKQIILTTTPGIEGYRITGYCGLVFGETVFRASVKDAIGKSIEDLGNSLQFTALEMSGAVSLLEQAREFALGKMLDQAAQRKCNAIVGIDNESSEMNGTIHVTIYGTAVQIEKV